MVKGMESPEWGRHCGPVLDRGGRRLPAHILEDQEAEKAEYGGFLLPFSFSP